LFVIWLVSAFFITGIFLLLFATNATLRGGYVPEVFLTQVAATTMPTTTTATVPDPTAGPTVTPLPAWVPELVEVPAGSFLMGSTDADPMADMNEKPQHSVELETYWIGKTEVTNAQFRPFVEGDGYTNRDYWTEAGWAWREENNITEPEFWNDPTWSGADQPVVGISWFEAIAYCRWLSARTGIEFYLPSEAEWEKAARGTEGLIWPWGNTWEAGRTNSKETGLNQTTPVGQFPSGASPYGALDMAGNVGEWCATQWEKEYPYQPENEWLRAYLDEDASRVLRGGSWQYGQKYVRGADRVSNEPLYRLIRIGMRVASRSPLPVAGE
jgi:formylglycine-generating enzyme required for sulfatase activity